MRCMREKVRVTFHMSGRKSLTYQPAVSFVPPFITIVSVLRQLAHSGSPIDRIDVVVFIARESTAWDIDLKTLGHCLGEWRPK